MDMLKDPEMADIVLEFCNESDGLCEELEDILEELEDEPTNTALLEKYGQIIDRIMGAAKSLGAEKIGRYSELCKTISYKASQTNDPKLLSIVTAVLFDTTDILRELLKSVREHKEERVSDKSAQAIASRLKWISEKFSHIERASVAVNSDEDEK